MNEYEIYLNEVEDELEGLESKLNIVYHYHNDKITRISIKDSNKILKVLGYKIKDVVMLLDWLEEPRQLEAINYLR